MKSANHCFKPDSRLRKAAQFRAVKKNGRRFKDHLFWIQVMRNEKSESPKLGIIASRRFGGAVDRNRAKRRIREVFRRNQASFPKGIDLVVLPRTALLKASFSSLEQNFVDAVGKACSSS